MKRNKGKASRRRRKDDQAGRCRPDRRPAGLPEQAADPGKCVIASPGPRSTLVAVNEEPVPYRVVFGKPGDAVLWGLTVLEQLGQPWTPSSGASSQPIFFCTNRPEESDLSPFLFPHGLTLVTHDLSPQVKDPLTFQLDTRP